MSKTSITRVDYMPGPAALEVLAIAESLLPDSWQKELLDRLVTAGLSALARKHWKPPYLYGKDSDT
jgi:hypothetical protein